MSDAEKIQKAIGYCNNILSINSANEFERGLDIACQEILEILEGE